MSWAESGAVKVDGHIFSASLGPQLVAPMQAMIDLDCRIGTLIKPVQTGGSTVGEIVCAFWAAFNSGLIQFNWQDQNKAETRWRERIYPALKSCKEIKLTGERFDAVICELRAVNATVRVQGVFAEGALDSDTVPFQINEEVHLWKPGFLSKARRRQTRIWNSKALDISNAGNKGEQLHHAYLDGTQEVWETACPVCGQFHAMHFRWESNHPELGGLRWDTEDVEEEKRGRINYNYIAKTLRYQFPCGHELRDDVGVRRKLAGRYRQTNDGALSSHRSWNYEAVSCDSIRWITLVKEWHLALAAMRAGDLEPLRRFTTERECKFWSEDYRPYVGTIELTPNLIKSRDGMASRVARLWAADKQAGYKARGELSHFWLVIRDVDEHCNSQLVWEGQVATESELVGILDDHKCQRHLGGVDAAWDTKHVLEFCYREGLNAFTANTSHRGLFRHPDGSYRFFADPKPLHRELGMPPRNDYVFANGMSLPTAEEPRVVQHNVAGLLGNLFFIREHEQRVRENGGNDFIAWRVPSDVSDEYRDQLESWERVAIGSKGGDVEGFKQVHPDDHLLMCEAYIAMVMEMSGLLPSRMTALKQ